MVVSIGYHGIVFTPPKWTNDGVHCVPCDGKMRPDNAGGLKVGVGDALICIKNIGPGRHMHQSLLGGVSSVRYKLLLEKATINRTFLILPFF